MKNIVSNTLFVPRYSHFHTFPSSFSLPVILTSLLHLYSLSWSLSLIACFSLFSILFILSLPSRPCLLLSFTLSRCFTPSPCVSLFLSPFFIFVTHSFLLSLFPCLTHWLSILIFLHVYSPTLSFSVSVFKSLCLSVSQSFFPLFISLPPSVWLFFCCYPSVSLFLS